MPYINFVLHRATACECGEEQGRYAFGFLTLDNEIYSDGFRLILLSVASHNKLKLIINLSQYLRNISLTPELYPLVLEFAKVSTVDVPMSWTTHFLSAIKGL